MTGPKMRTSEVDNEVLRLIEAKAMGIYPNGHTFWSGADGKIVKEAYEEIERLQIEVNRLTAQASTESGGTPLLDELRRGAQ